MRIEMFSRRWAYFGGLKWFFRIRAANGEVIAQSEAYSRKIDAMSTVRLLRAQLPTAEIVDA